MRLMSGTNVFLEFVCITSFILDTQPCLELNKVNEYNFQANRLRTSMLRTAQNVSNGIKRNKNGKRTIEDEKNGWHTEYIQKKKRKKRKKTYILLKKYAWLHDILSQWQRINSNISLLKREFFTQRILLCVCVYTRFFFCVNISLCTICYGFYFLPASFFYIIYFSFFLWLCRFLFPFSNLSLQRIYAPHLNVYLSQLFRYWIFDCRKFHVFIIEGLFDLMNVKSINLMICCFSKKKWKKRRKGKRNRI